VSLLLGGSVWKHLEELRTRRVTGRSARLLNRFFGELLVHRRNPYLFEELVSSGARRRRFFANVEKDLALVEANAGGEALVFEVLGESRRALEAFRSDVDAAPQLRRLLGRELGAIVGPESVRFDPFTLVSHATDATDWRLFLPLAVTYPTAEAQVAPLLAAIARLGLKALPRGAGTGLTGGAVPLHPRCVVVNTERLDRIRGFGDFLHYHLLAAGKIEAVIESNIHILDVAALAVIVEEAGGRVTDLDGAPLSLASTSILASNGHLHEPILEEFRR